ncbi:MAG: MarR family winged helix-turn-helix transcriptional regulator [Hyphomicrobium sp.]
MNLKVTPINFANIAILHILAAALSLAAMQNRGRLFYALVRPTMFGLGASIAYLSWIAGEPAWVPALLFTAGAVDRSTLADVVKRLVNRRMIARKRSKSDARAYVLSLTDDGRKAVTHAEPVLKAVEKQMLANIPAKQRADLLANLEALSAAS